MRKEVAEATEAARSLRETLERREAELEARTAELAARNEVASELERQLAFVEERLEEAKHQADAERAKGEKKETRIASLMRTLDDVQGDLAHTSGALKKKDSSVVAANDLLESLKPMIEALESKLKE